MRVFFIGFGQAGWKLVDMFLAQDRKLGSTSFRGIVINTARTDLMGIKNIPMEDRLLIGQTMVKGHGVGTDNVTGAKVAADEIDTIISAIDRRGTHDIGLMTHIVAELTRAGMSDAWIMKNIGMDKDELLRLKQVSGLASLFAHADFSIPEPKEEIPEDNDD